MTLPPPLPHELPRKKGSKTKWITLVILGMVAFVGALALMALLTTTVATDVLATRLQSYADAGEYDEGLALAERELDSVVPDAELYFAMQNLHFGANNLEETRHYGLKTLEHDPENEMALLFLLVILGDFDLPEEGLELGRDWISRHDHGIEVYRHLAILAEEAGYRDDAINYARTAHLRAPAKPRLAGIYFYFLMLEMEDTDAAMAIVDAWVETNEPDGFFFEQVGKGLSEAGEAERAIPVLEKALAMGEKSDDVFTEMLDSFRALSDRERAEAFVAEHEEYFANDADLLRAMGALEYDVGDFELALDYFRRAQAVDPPAPLSMSNIVFTLCQLDRPDEAEEEGRAWLKQHGLAPTVSFHRAMATTYHSRDRWQDALREYRLGLKIDPRCVSCARDIVTSLVHLNQRAEAIAFGQEWRALNPDIEDISFDRALAAAREM